MDLLDKPTRKRLAHKLSTPIILDLFSRYRDDGRDNIRAYAYEDLLLAHGLERPSQLRGKSGLFDKQLLIYYLRNLCIPEVMQNSAVFRGSRELEDERSAVCALLIELDDANVKEYEGEIREITRSQIIQRGVRHAEQSKIFVDIPAVKRWAERHLKESFARFQGLRASGISVGEAELKKAVEAVFSETPTRGQLLELPKNEATDLLLGLVKQLLTQLLANPEHGLDCYLSMRIRHGALSGQLRAAPVEDEKIITHRDDATDSYKSNEFWRSRLSGIEDAQKNELDLILQQFSRSYDYFIDSFANDYIQVAGVERPLGLFDFVFSSVDFFILIDAIKSDASFDVFFEWCVEFFWKNIEASLQAVRTHIDRVLKQKLNEILVALYSRVSLLLSVRVKTHDLDSAIRTAQTRAQQSLEDVKDWFRRSQPSEQQRFSFDDLVQIGLQFVRKAHHDFEPRLELSFGLLPEFIDLQLFSDIFSIVFDNIRRHSGNSIDPEVLVEDGNAPGAAKNQDFK